MAGHTSRIVGTLSERQQALLTQNYRIVYEHVETAYHLLNDSRRLVGSRYPDAQQVTLLLQREMWMLGDLLVELWERGIELRLLAGNEVREGVRAEKQLRRVGGAVNKR